MRLIVVDRCCRRLYAAFLYAICRIHDPMPIMGVRKSLRNDGRSYLSQIIRAHPPPSLGSGSERFASSIAPASELHPAAADGEVRHAMKRAIANTSVPSRHRSPITL